MKMACLFVTFRCIVFICATEIFFGVAGVSESKEETSVIPNEFIIVTKKWDVSNDSTGPKDLLMRIYSLNLRKQVTLGNKVFMVVEGSPDAVQKMATGQGGVNFDVIHNEPVKVVHAFPTTQRLTTTDEFDHTSQVGVSTSPTAPEPQCAIQNVPTIWGLDRTDQREPLTSSERVYTYGASDTGSGVDVYVVDSGITHQHPEFDGRASWGFTASNMDGDSDLNGHGTHVAGIIGSRTFGIAKNSTLVAVKVLNGRGVGSTSGIIEGFNWIMNEFVRAGRPKSVINLSLGVLGTSETLDAAVESLIEEGIPVVIAAGNEYSDACDVSPARVQSALTVGASDRNDKVADFSNWGTCVDLFAPGHEIPSTSNNFLSATLSGTSQAAPHVAGVVARYLSTRGSTTVTPAAVTEWVLSVSSKDRLTFQGKAEATSPNRLLYMHCYTGGEWEHEAGPGTGGAAYIHNNSAHLVMCVFLLTIVAQLL